MAEEKIENKERKFEPFHPKNPFCRTPEKVKISEINDHTVYRFNGGKVDKETMQYTPEIEAVDLHEEIQSCADLAGVEYMKKLLLTGQAKPEDFYDDGKGSADLTQVPGSIHEANKLADEEAAKIAEMAKEAGLKEGFNYTQEQFEQAVKEATAKIFQEAQAKAQANGQTKTAEGGDK